MVTMARKTTNRALESSLTERHIIPCSAPTASATTTPCLRVFSKLSTASYRFVGKHLIEPTPRNIKNVLSEPACFEHVLNVQPLTTNNFVFFSDETAGFMQKVSPLIENFQVLLCEFDAGFFSVFASFDSLAVDSLQSCQLPLSTYIESGVGNALPFVVGQEILQTNINPNFGSGWMFDFWNVNFTGKDCKPLPGMILLDSQGLDFSLRDAMQDDWQVANLGNLQSSIIEEFESALGVCDASYFAFETRKTLLPTKGVFDPMKEVVQRLMNSVRNVLQDLRVNPCKLFRNSEFYVRNKGIEVISACEKMLSVLSKKNVIDFLANLELVEKSDLLFPRGIQPVLIHPAELHRGKYYV